MGSATKLEHAGPRRFTGARARQLVTTMALSALLASALAVAHAVETASIEPPPRMAFVARADNPADALAVGPIAGKFGAPLYTTWPSELVPAAEAGLQAYGPELVIIAGGDGAIHPSTAQAIQKALPDAEVIRVFGEGRNETARKISELIDDYNPAHLPVDATARNAEMLDGKDATAFARSDQSCTTGQVVTGIDAAGLPTCVADEVDGGDADKLDGRDSSTFASSNHDHFIRSVTGSARPDGSVWAVVATNTSTLADPCGGARTVWTVLMRASGVFHNAHDFQWGFIPRLRIGTGTPPEASGSWMNAPPRTVQGWSTEHVTTTGPGTNTFQLVAADNSSEDPSKITVDGRLIIQTFGYRCAFVP